MKVKFVRHGQTDLNSPVKRMQGISNYDLNENGIRQAEETRDMLKDEKIDLIIASPLLRARHTANIINENRNIPMIIDDRIRERNYGSLEGELFKPEYCNLNYDYEKVNGESIENYKSRIMDFMEEIKIKYSDKKVLVVSHNGVISVLSCIPEGKPKDGSFVGRGIQNGQVKEFTF